MNVIAELEATLADHRYMYIGPCTLNCYGLARHMSFDLLVLLGYGLDDVWATSRIGADVISLERETYRRTWGVGMRPIFEGDVGAQVSSALLSQGSRRPVVSPFPSQELEDLAVASGGRLRVIAPPAGAAGRLSSKSALQQVLPSLGIEPLPHQICDLTALDFDTFERRYGLPFVVQQPAGAGGSGTFFVSAEQDLRSLQERLGAQEIIVSKYIAGFAPNINAVVLDDDVLLSYPSIQLVGVPECIPRKGGYCGNDFTTTRRLPEAAVQAMYDQTRRLGAWIGEQGFRGMWGIDFVVDGSRVYPLDLNPRFQGSTRLLTELQHLDGRAPLALAHVAGFLDGGQALLKRLSAHWGNPQPLAGAQIDLKSLEQDWCVVRGSIRPGVYEWDGSGGIYRREGMTIADCENPDEFVLTGAVPRTGTRVQPGASLLRIQTPREVLGSQSNRLQPWAAELCIWTYRRLSLS